MAAALRQLRTVPRGPSAIGCGHRPRRATRAAQGSVIEVEVEADRTQSILRSSGRCRLAAGRSGCGAPTSIRSPGAQ